MARSLVERWLSDDEGEQLSICAGCKNYLNNLTCKAFPEGIPAEILNGENNHSKPLPDQQNDIVFEPKTNNK